MDGGQRTAPDGFRDVRRASPGRGPVCRPNFRLQLSLPTATVIPHAFTRLRTCLAALIGRSSSILDLHRLKRTVIRLLRSGCDAGIAGNIQIAPSREF